MIERTAHAKINLALHVTGQRDDGYHLLDSLVVFTEFGDTIEVSEPHHPHGPLEVSVDGPFSENLSCGSGNLISSAALLLLDVVKREIDKPKAARVKLTKNLPIASGIGGGSADAAATLLALHEFWGIEVDLLPLARILGADVPMCLHSRPLRARGIGDEITLLDNQKPLHLVLVNPGIEIATPEVFGKLSAKNNPAILETSVTHLPSINDISLMRNDLQAPAQSFQPVISEVLEVIASKGALVSRMSGSGATCFGIFETLEEATAACKTLKQEKPHWWCVATNTTVA